MYYVVILKEYKMLKSDIFVIERTDSLEKAAALRDALRAIHPNDRYEVMHIE